MVHYNFGVYHWRQRLRTVLSALGVAVLSLQVWRTSSSRRVRLVATAATAGAVVHGTGAMRRVLHPPPWALDRYKYAVLADELPFERADRALDIGCGTGRSLVGLAPTIPESCTVVGLDVFDNRIILGNAPLLAQRNGRKAGIDVSPVAGDAARLPVATDSQDVLTACRVLHDLPAAYARRPPRGGHGAPDTDAERTLREAHRTCAPDGVLGVLELPITPDDADGAIVSPEMYWRERVSEAGFAIETVERLDRRRRDDQYVLIVATP
jgi:ubiquinone/menaquinone biosynthesis C-methylase UbiE